MRSYAASEIEILRSQSLVTRAVLESGLNADVSRAGQAPPRYLDWLDWMLPEAWVFEHNVLHHSHTGEDADPDLLPPSLRRGDLPDLQRLGAPLAGDHHGSHRSSPRAEG